jgi:hypothetical protein
MYFPAILNSAKKMERIRFRVARWFVFKPKIPIWVNIEGSCNGR